MWVVSEKAPLTARFLLLMALSSNTIAPVFDAREAQFRCTKVDVSFHKSGITRPSLCDFAPRVAPPAAPMYVHKKMLRGPHDVLTHYVDSRPETALHHGHQKYM